MNLDLLVIARPDILKALAVVVGVFWIAAICLLADGFGIVKCRYGGEERGQQTRRGRRETVKKEA